MSTTKLTRKEISADPIHDALINTIETVSANAKIIIWVAAGLIVVGLAAYFGMGYLESRNNRAQQELARGMDFYHGLLDARATEDPYSLGPTPVFRTDQDRVRAASTVFGSLAGRSGPSKIRAMARYYLGLCQLRLGQKNEAIASLEAAANNTADRTVGYLAKKVMATYYVESGDAKKGQEILQGMLKDPQCDLPKEDLQVYLSRALVAQGKRDEAVKILKEAQDAGIGGGMLQSLIFQELSRIQSSSGSGPVEQKMP